MKFNLSLFIKEKNSLFENSIIDFNNKMGLIEKQYDLTIDLYQKEHKNKLRTLVKEYNDKFEKAKKAYSELIASYSRKGYYKFEEENLNSYKEFLIEEYSEKEEELKELNNDFFDNFSKSILVSLDSIVESKLKQLCTILQEDLNKKIGYSDLNNNNYFATSIKYFSLVLEIPMGDFQSIISKLEDFQLIRNKVVHIDYTEGIEAKSIKYDSLEIVKKNGIKVLKIKSKDFIKKYTELLRDFFEKVVWKIDAHRSNQILKKRIEFQFSLLGLDKFQIENLTVTPVGEFKKKIELSLININNTKFNFRINIKRSVSASIKITDQTENPNIKRLVNWINEDADNTFSHIFKTFNLSVKELEIDIMIW